MRVEQPATCFATRARRLRAAVCASSLLWFSPVAHAQTNAWAAVQTLLRGSELVVQRHNGEAVHGRLDSVDEGRLIIITRRPFSLMKRPLSEHSVAVRRSAIREVDWVITRRRDFLGNRHDDRAVVYINQQQP